MTRKQAIVAIRVAGSEDDRRAFMRLYVENRISFSVAEQAWREGQKVWEAQRRARWIAGENLTATISGAA